MNTILGQSNLKSDWVGIELISGKKIYARLPFDPFGSPADEIPKEGIIRIDSEVFIVAKMYTGTGQVKMSLATFRNDAGESAEPPYLLNAEHISMITKLAQDCQLYEIFTQQSSDLVVPQRPSLVVP